MKLRKLKKIRYNRKKTLIKKYNIFISTINEKKKQ